MRENASGEERDLVGALDTRTRAIPEVFRARARARERRQSMQICKYVDYEAIRREMQISGASNYARGGNALFPPEIINYLD